MKRLLTLLLAVCLLAGLSTVAFAAETGSDPTRYATPLEQAIRKNAGTAFGEAMLCDLDGSGTPELVMFYQNQGACVVSVYTVREGKAVRILAPKTVFAPAAGNDGYVAQAMRDGKTFLLTYSSSPEAMGDTVVTTGEVRLYAMRGGKLSTEAEMTFTETRYVGGAGDSYVLEDQSSSVIGGAKKSFAEFEDFMASLQLPMLNKGYTDSNFQDDALPLKTMLNRLSTGFDDVGPKAYYATPVIWAAENGITAGTSATAFSPEAGCTRAQFVTFLWRAMGSPAVTADSNPFKDVKQGSYYFDAVLWAVNKGITAGTTKTTFSPNDTLTRAQTATFLWRLEGQPSASGGTSFKDVSSGAYYAKAVRWAAKQGITSGTSGTTFSPRDTCTRAQTVTFLYRDLAG